MFKVLKLILIIIFISSSTYSDEKITFLSLKSDKVNVRYGPGLNFPIKFIYKKKSLPVKVIDSKENFRKIIDHKKNSGWIHRVMLKKSDSLIVINDQILFKKPSKFSEPMARLEKGRLAYIKKCITNWCKIKTGDFIGWLETESVWGISN
jgi:SH3-like domain-containing protein|tara:strand:+ start:316 stop:765 length:450 start_codon:yes stop_codon:yes gene_type:complete